MKKLISLFALVLFLGVVANAQTATTTDTKEKVVKCTEAEKAKCEKDAAKSGAKCETTAKSGSCCQKGSGTTSAGSCCKKGGASGTTEAASAKGKKAKGAKVAKTTASVSTEKK